jgi:prophage maintenance system killer protein
VIFFSEDQVKRIHSSLIKKTGGLDGLRDNRLLDSALNSPFQTFDSKELIDFGYGVASGKISKEEIKEWIQLHK